MNAQTIPRPRIALAGAVGSSRRTLAALLRHRAEVVGVLGLEGAAAGGVSGYARLDDLAGSAGIPYRDFARINHPEIIAAVRAWAPDLLFVVGLSQLVEAPLLAVPRLGCVGFHPTRLPEDRGRAPIAWLTLDGRPGAASFFLMDDGADSGPLLAQQPFPVAAGDYADQVLARAEDAIDAALDAWLPRLLAGEWRPVPQDHARATCLGRRSPADGRIAWDQPAARILALIRAASRPYPGAYTYVGDRRLIVWRADPEPGGAHRGVIGGILRNEPGRGLLVQTGDGLLWLSEVEVAAEGAADGSPIRLQVGTTLDPAPQDEVYRLKRRIAQLEERLARLERQGGQA